MTSTSAQPGAAPAVFCADDNPLVTYALQRYIQRSPDFRWMGCAENADSLLDDVSRQGCPDIVLLDIDMPGMDPFEAIGELLARCGHTRVLMYSGMVKRELIDRAIEAGAWGYVSKGDGEEALFEAMRRAMNGELGLSPEARAIYSA